MDDQPTDRPISRDANPADASVNMLVWYWGRRGAPVRMTYELARALAQRSDVRPFLSLSRQSELFAETTALGLPGYHVDTYFGALSALTGTVLRLPAACLGLRRFVQANNIGIAFSMMRHPWSPLAFAAMRRSGVRVLMALHDATPHPGEDYPLWRQHLELDLGSTDGIVVMSDHVREAAIELYGYPADRIWHMPLTISYNDIRVEPRRLPAGRPPRLLFFGRIVDYKGLDILADAFRQLSARRPVELRIVGSGHVPAIEVLRSMPGVTLDIRWIPENEIAPILDDVDVLVAPYREASQSGVVPSAYHLGLPVVGTPVGGLVEQIRDGQTGLVSASADGPALAAALARLLDEDGLYARCSAGALAASRDELSIDAFTESLCRIARSLTTMPPR